MDHSRLWMKCISVAATMIASVPTCVLSTSNSTPSCNTTRLELNIQQPIFSVAILGSTVNVLMNVALIAAVKLTPSLKGITGWLLIHEYISSVLYEFSVLYTIISDSIVAFVTFSGSLRLASIILLTIQNMNMHLAVCRPNSEAHKMLTSRRCYISAIAATWVLPGVFCVVRMQPIYYDVRCEDGIMKITISNVGLSVESISLVFAVICPLIIDLYCIFSINKARKVVPPFYTFRQAQLKRQALNKAKLIFIVTLLSSVFVVPYIVIRYLKMVLDPINGVIARMMTVSMILGHCYELFRPFIYLISYKPIWISTKRLFCCPWTNAISIPVEPTSNSSNVAEARV